MRAAILAAFLLAGCSNGLVGEGSFTRDAADQIIPAETPAERGLRACLATSVVSELITYRLQWFPSTVEERSDGRAAMETMLKTVQKVRSGMDPTLQDPFWVETEMFYVIFGLVHSVEGTLTDSVLETVGDALTGQVGDLLSTMRVRAGQVALANFMIEDIQRYFKQENAGDADWLEHGWAMCESRVKSNITKLE